MSEHNTVCTNTRCYFYNKNNSKSIIKKGKNSAGHQKYLCVQCNKCFTETKGSLLYNKKLKEDDIKKICRQIIEQKTIREIARITHHHKDTICHLVDALAVHAPEVTKQILCKLCKNEHEQYEFWRWVKHRKRNLSKQAMTELIKTENKLKEKF